ncbi:hypothetical protein [Kordia sp.]|uniref:hypothetical protein n=1 Tax=Kordia sp. TaxID=1965332 RepID=UPI003B5C27D2
MKKKRKLNLNKVSIVSLKNMHTIVGGDSVIGGGGTSKTCKTGDPTTTSNSTGTHDPNQYPTTNNNGDTFGVLISQPGNECKIDDLTD